MTGAVGARPAFNHTMVLKLTQPRDQDGTEISGTAVHLGTEVASPAHSLHIPLLKNGLERPRAVDEMHAVAAGVKISGIDDASRIRQAMLQTIDERYPVDASPLSIVVLGKTEPGVNWPFIIRK